MEELTIIANKPYNNVTEYKSHKKQKNKTRRKKARHSVTEILNREKLAKGAKKAIRKFDVTKERDSLISDMEKYLKYASGRVINLTMLSNMIKEKTEGCELQEATRDCLTKSNELIDIYQKNIQEIKTSIDICKRLNKELDISAAMEATMNLSGELVEIMSEAESIEQQVVELIAPYKDELREYIVSKFSNPINVAQAEDILDVDNNAEEESVMSDNEDLHNEHAEETEETKESSRL